MEERRSYPPDNDNGTVYDESRFTGLRNRCLITEGTGHPRTTVDLERCDLITEPTPRPVTYRVARDRHVGAGGNVAQFRARTHTDALDLNRYRSSIADWRIRIPPIRHTSASRSVNLDNFNQYLSSTNCG